MSSVPGKLYGGLVGGLALLLGLVALDALLPPPLEQAQQVSTVVRDRHGIVLRAFPVEDGRWRLAADLDEIDPDLITALIAYEDERFFQHWGADPIAIVRAGWNGLRAGRVVSGASTLSMQLARLLEPQERTFGAKIQQVLRAFQIELRLSKREILEHYLTLAPYGGNLEGVRAASWAYFGREPDALTIEQIALLIALPQSPEARRPDLRPETARTARSRVLDRLARVGLAAPGAALDAAQDPVPGRNAFPARAWHAAQWVASVPQPELVTTLDAGLQEGLEQLAADSLPLTDPDVQIAIMVVEIEGRAVRAAIGSAGRARPGGWIDLTHRLRSPGSTLKPFIYAMAFDDGLAAGGTLIADLPRRFSGYQPDNFDRRFRGDVTIAEALQHSLNIPAVTTLDGVGARRFSAALQFAGAQPQRRRSAGRDDGLAVALGGAGLSVRQLALLYAALGDEGRAQPLRWLENAPLASGDFGLVTAESAEEVLEILRRAPHPGGRMPAVLSQGAPEISFKTGTSYGFRDAWAAGVAGDYAVVVWVGRADGAPRDGVTGRAGALPLLFRAFDLVAAFDPDANLSAPARDEGREIPVTLQRYQPNSAPHILFPPDGADVLADQAGHGFVLAAQGSGTLSWYADGQPITPDATGDFVWRPEGPGFYSILVVDGQGRQTRSRVRVLSHRTG
jgi:penicillin-binding protein 1C